MGSKDFIIGALGGALAGLTVSQATEKNRYSRIEQKLDEIALNISKLNTLSDILQAIRDMSKSMRAKPVIDFLNGYKEIFIPASSPPDAVFIEEIASEKGNIQPKFLMVILSDWLRAEVHAIINDQDLMLASDLYAPITLIDVEWMYGVVEASKLVFKVYNMYSVNQAGQATIVYYGSVVPPG